MSGTYRLKLANGTRIFERDLDIAIAKASARNLRICKAAFLCTWGCGKIHNLVRAEKQLVRAHNCSLQGRDL